MSPGPSLLRVDRVAIEVKPNRRKCDQKLPSKHGAHVDLASVTSNNDFGCNLLLIIFLSSRLLVSNLMTLLDKTIPGVVLDTNQNNEGDCTDDISLGETASDDDQADAHSINSKLERSRTGTTGDDANMINEDLARHESTNVFRLRILVIMILVVVANVVAITTFQDHHRSEIAAFIAEFEKNADMIVTSLNGKYKMICMIDSH